MKAKKRNNGTDKENQMKNLECYAFFFTFRRWFFFSIPSTILPVCPLSFRHPVCFCICSLWMTTCILWTVSMKFPWCTPIPTDAMDNGIYYLAFCRKETQLSILTFPLIQRIKEFSLILVAFFAFGLPMRAYPPPSHWKSIQIS